MDSKSLAVLQWATGGIATPTISPWTVIYADCTIWQVTVVHFYLRANPKTKPSLVRGLSTYEVSLSPMPI
jgi:Na+/H+ antiporter NhaB